MGKQNSSPSDSERPLDISPVGLHSFLLPSHSKVLLGRMVDTFLGHRHHSTHVDTHTFGVPLIFDHLRISTFSKWLRFVVFVTNPRKRQRIGYSAVEVKDAASQYTKVSGILRLALLVYWVYWLSRPFGILYRWSFVRLCELVLWP